jgi:hypothetical protein
MGFTLQSFSPPRSRTPFGASALMPFLTSRSSALRTKRSRCPAASGLSSPRGSVSRSGPKTGGTDALLGLSASPERPACRGAGFPTPSFLRFCRPISEETGRPALQGLDEHAEWKTPSRALPTLLRFPTRTCPRVPPTTAASCRTDPTGSGARPAESMRSEDRSAFRRRRPGAFRRTPR